MNVPISDYSHAASDRRAPLCSAQAVWVKYPHADGVFVSRDGRVAKRINVTHPERRQWMEYKPDTDKDGYLHVRIKGRKWSVHRLVYAMFNGDLIDGQVICHINGNPSDNRSANLLQASQAENISHKRIHGTWQIGETHPRSKISCAQAAKIKLLLLGAARTPTGRIAHGEHIRIARDTGASIHIVRDIYLKGAWGHV